MTRVMLSSIFLVWLPVLPAAGSPFFVDEPPGGSMAYSWDFDSDESTPDYAPNSGATARIVEVSDGNRALAVALRKAGGGAVVFSVPEGAAEGATGLALSVRSNQPELRFNPTVSLKDTEGREHFIDPNFSADARAMRFDSDTWKHLHIPLRHFHLDAAGVKSIRHITLFFFNEKDAGRDILLDNLSLVSNAGDVVDYAGPYRRAAPQSSKLFFTDFELPNLRGKIERDETLSLIYERFKERVAAYQSIPTDPYRGFEAKDGDTLSHQGRMLHSHMLGTAFVGLIEEDDAYIRKAVDMLVSTCEQFGPQELFAMHRIALNVGDMALPVVIGYDWLNAHMSDEERLIVKNRVYEYAAWTHTFSPESHWGKDGYARECSNWNAVLHGPMGLAAVVLGDQPEWEALAVRKIDAFLEHSVDANGAPRESGHYLSLGCSSAYAFVKAYKRCRNKDLLAPHRDRLSGIPRYFAEMMLPWGGGSLNVSQGDAGPELVSWFLELGGYLKDPLANWVYFRLYGDPEADGGKGTWGASSHAMHKAVTPFISLAWEEFVTPRDPKSLDLPLSATFRSGQVTARTSWDDDAAMLHFKCDETWGGWSHADDNTFSFFAYGDAIVTDPGAHFYFTRFHNAILIDGQGHGWKGGGDVAGKIVHFQDHGSYVVVRGDATPAYARYVDGQPHLDIRHALRTVFFVREPRPILLIHDDVAMNGDAEHDYSLLYHYGQRSRPAQLALSAEALTVQATGARRQVPSVTQLLWPRTGVELKEREDLSNSLASVAFSTRDKAVQFVSVIAPVPPGEALPVILSEGSPSSMKIAIEYANGEMVRLDWKELQISLQHRPAGGRVP